jgi:anaerobic C4-dicarboxylate transporter
LFDHYPKAEATLSSQNYQRVNKKTASTFKKKVRILGILGDASGIDITKDRIYIERLSKQATIEFCQNLNQKNCTKKSVKAGTFCFLLVIVAVKKRVNST